MTLVLGTAGAEAHIGGHAVCPKAASIKKRLVSLVCGLGPCWVRQESGALIHKKK